MWTKDQVLLKYQVSSLLDIKNWNMWGSDWEDISVIGEMPNLEIISLSWNKINTWHPFSKCLKLKELYLRKNEITDINEIKFLSNLSELKVLWLGENPVCNVDNYRNIVCDMWPQIVKLDNIVVDKPIQLQEPEKNKSDDTNSNILNNDITNSILLNEEIDRILNTPKDNNINRVNTQEKRNPTNSMNIKPLTSLDFEVQKILQNVEPSMTATQLTPLGQEEEITKKWENIEDIKSYFSGNNNVISPLQNQNIIIPKLKNYQGNQIVPSANLEGQYNTNQVNNNLHQHPWIKQNRIHQSEKALRVWSPPIQSNYGGSEQPNINSNSKGNGHVMTAILNWIEDLTWRDLIHVRNEINKEIKNNNNS